MILIGSSVSGCWITESACDFVLCARSRRFVTELVRNLWLCRMEGNWLVAIGRLFDAIKEHDETALVVQAYHVVSQLYNTVRMCYRDI
jgi:hypothetical protein